MGSSSFKLSILVTNRFGVLSRVTGLFSKRGYNIDSLHVEPVGNTGNSEIILTSNGDDLVKEQIIKQLQKLHDVQQVILLDRNSI